MAEEKKRFPWWLVVCAVVAVLLAAVIGFIETVGRRGTPADRYERVGKGILTKAGMVKEDIVAILGAPTKIENGSKRGEICVWQDGPAEIRVCFSHTRDDEWEAIWSRFDEDGAYRRSVTWRIRRWAEQAYTAIHGRRR
jgi:hypothetical protein